MSYKERWQTEQEEVEEAFDERFGPPPDDGLVERIVNAVRRAFNEGWNPNDQPRGPDGRFLEEPDVDDALETLTNELTLGPGDVNMDQLNLPRDIQDEFYSEIKKRDSDEITTEMLKDILTSESADPTMRDQVAQAIVAKHGTREFDYIPRQQLNDAESDIDEIEGPQAIANRAAAAIGNEIRIDADISDEQARILANGTFDVAREHGIQHIGDMEVKSIIKPAPNGGQPLAYTDQYGDITFSVDGLDTDTINKAYRQGHLSTNNPRHVVYHELAHSLHQDGLSSDEWDVLRGGGYDDIGIEPPDAIDQRMIEDVLGRYAISHSVEFWAEAFTFKMDGGELPDTLQKRYEAYQ
jgi:hypothetical protein